MFSFVVTIFILILIIIGFAMKQFTQPRKNKDFYKNIRGPRGLPILGSALDFKTTKGKYINYNKK